MATSSPVAMLAPEETRAEIPTAVSTIAPLHVRGPKTNEHKGKSEFSARIKEGKKKKVQFEKRGSPHTNVERTSPAESWVKRLRTEEKKKEKRKWMLQLTEVNVSKRTTPYLSPEPVLVPNSQLHAANLSLSQWENADIKIKQQTYKLSIIAPLSPLQL